MERWRERRKGDRAWRVIVITPEVLEGAWWKEIRKMLGLKVWRLHIRMPNVAVEEIVEQLSHLTEAERSRLAVHYYAKVSEVYPEVTLHESGRNRDEGLMYKSRSMHCLEELEESKGYEYVFLSPIFDSVSKVGYRARFGEEALYRALGPESGRENVIALGGVTRKTVERAWEMWFGGVAVLGSAWNGSEANIEEMEAIIEAVEE